MLKCRESLLPTYWRGMICRRRQVIRCVCCRWFFVVCKPSVYFCSNEDSCCAPVQPNHKCYRVRQQSLETVHVHCGEVVVKAKHPGNYEPSCGRDDCAGNSESPGARRTRAKTYSISNTTKTKRVASDHFRRVA